MAKIFHAYSDINIGKDLHNNKYYRTTAVGGYNKCRDRYSWGTKSVNTVYQEDENNEGHKMTVTFYKGCVLPNCTGYAYGRFMECQGITSCKLCIGDAGSWYYYKDNYKRGSQPRRGAVLCWPGHVAVVEDFTDAHNVTWSESNYSKGRYFNIVTGDPTGKNGGLIGYIYPDTIFDGFDQTSVGGPNRYSLGNVSFIVGYYPNQKESNLINNAICVYLDLKDKGWADKPIYAVLGNMQRESALDPTAKYTVGKNDAYGLLQWDKSAKIKNWASSNGKSASDGFAQLEYLVTQHSKEWFKKGEYQLTWDEFIHDTTHTTEWLTWAFEEEYERAGIKAMSDRIKYANYWEQYFSTHDLSADADISYLPSTVFSGDSSSFSGDFEYSKPNNKHLLLTSAWL